MLTCDEKLPMAVAVKLTATCDPAFTVWLGGLRARMKSGDDDEPEEELPPPFPPQAVSTTSRANEVNRAAIVENWDAL